MELNESIKNLQDKILKLKMSGGRFIEIRELQKELDSLEKVKHKREMRSMDEFSRYSEFELSDMTTTQKDDYKEQLKQYLNALVIHSRKIKNRVVPKSIYEGELLEGDSDFVVLDEKMTTFDTSSIDDEILRITKQLNELENE